MLMTIEELRQYINTDKTDAVLEAQLKSLELLIRKYTNNNFQDRARRFRCNVSSTSGLMCASSLFSVGDTVQVTDTAYNGGLYTITHIDMDNGYTKLNEALTDELDVLVTKIAYPMDVKMGAVNMLKWDIENRDKVGIQSETISRHSVTYFDMGSDNSTMGYPKSLLGFLQPYKKARF